MAPVPEILGAELFRSLCESMAAGVAVLDADGRIVYWNPAAERIAGRPRASVMGLTCAALLPDDYEQEPASCAVASSALPPEGGDVSCALLKGDGTVTDVIRSVRWFEPPPSRLEAASGGPDRRPWAVISFVDVAAARRQQAELEALRDELRPRDSFFGLVGSSRPMNVLYALIERIAPTPSTVFVTGESGTGKELVAAAIHYASPRAGRPFLSLNCAAVPTELFESELFGHARGSFTGAVRDRVGRFEAADGGTLFLDEIGEMPLAAQAKMLRVLQQRQFERLGEVRVRNADVRVITATNRDLKAEVAAGRFREDLYFRLRVIELRVPPLREHKVDIPQLVAHFLRIHADRAHRRITGAEPEVLRELMRRDWPGNVRELENQVEYAVALAAGETLTLADLPVPTENERPSPQLPEALSLPCDLEAYIAAIERENIERALSAAGGVKAEAARLLGLSERVLRYKLDKVRTTKLS